MLWLVEYDKYAMVSKEKMLRENEVGRSMLKE
jgi:hypothetical protein